MRKKRIAFLLGGFNSNGGIGRVTSIIANQLAELQEYDIYLITIKKWAPEEFIYSVSEKILGEGWNDDRTMTSIMLHGGARRLRKYLNRNKIDLLIACGALFFPIAVLACKRINTKCIAWEHSNANNKADHKFQMEARWIGAKFADAVLVLTKKDRELYQKRYSAKTVYQIYNPIDPNMRKKQAEVAKKKIISVGRLCYQKNYPALIQVAKKVLSSCPDWVWDIYGEGPDHKNIQIMIDNTNVSNRLTLMGQITDIYERYPDYSMLVMTSRYEGFSMVLNEAMNAGIPVVAFDVECGPNEIIRDGKNGFLIEPFNTSKMAERIIQMCRDSVLRKRMSQEAFTDSAAFCIENIITMWNATITEICD